eukprot:gnl/TRDRNA2_/TRDRNA2_79957_c0_seq1.p1 gnl/TRDRNA2_/TRDRNA2_79957_c0~~gnl/TRDRNA2_/TRDRNA2_79957_c0_seq1.p1  ORF type:complete len:120 (-),score=17.09 gnl/TRDRNA2_/TRDRNA2_79957_c0_seq1:111-470(-)
MPCESEAGTGTSRKSRFRRVCASMFTSDSSSGSSSTASSRDTFERPRTLRHLEDRLNAAIIRKHMTKDSTDHFTATSASKTLSTHRSVNDLTEIADMAIIQRQRENGRDQGSLLRAIVK